MSVTIEMSERQLKLGVFKLGASLAGFFILTALIASLLAGNGQSIAINSLLISVSFSLLMNGIVAGLKIVDWFDARRARQNG